MRILPILWSQPPTDEDWKRLSEARTALGYTDLIKPVQALEGSPQPVLCIGAFPSWLTDYTHVLDTLDEGLQDALSYCLDEQKHDVRKLEAFLLSQWMGTEVKYIETEDHDGGVRFV